MTHWFRFPVRAAAAGAVLLLSGCGGLPDLPGFGSDSPAPTLGGVQAQNIKLDDKAVRRAGEIYLTGFRFVADYYIDPVTPATLATTGLEGLSKYDSAVKLSSVGDRVTLHRGAQSMSWPAPRPNDAIRWSSIAAQATVAARQLSPDIAKQDSEELYKTVFMAALRRLDPVTRYETPEEARASHGQREGFDGIGVVLDDANPGVLHQVLETSPAAEADLRAGDRLVRIDGKPITGLGTRAIVNLLRGPRNSTVELEVVRDTRPPFLVTVARRHIIPRSVSFSWTGSNRDLAVFKVTSFNVATTKDLRAAILKARAESPRLAGVILDLRGNPGGYLEQGVNVAALFLPPSRVLTIRGRHSGSHKDHYSDGQDLTDGAPMVVLVDGNSASAAEVVAAALQDLGRAVVIGTASYGKGTVQHVFEHMPNKAALYVTWAKLHAPSGYTIHGLGVHPTICTSLDRPLESWVADLRAHRLSANQTIEARRRVENQVGPERIAFEQECPKRTQRLPAGVDPEMDAALRLLGQPDLMHAALPPSHALR